MHPVRAKGEHSALAAAGKRSPERDLHTCATCHETFNRRRVYQALRTHGGVGQEMLALLCLTSEELEYCVDCFLQATQGERRSLTLLAKSALLEAATHPEAVRPDMPAPTKSWRFDPDRQIAFVVGMNRQTEIRNARSIARALEEQALAAGGNPELEAMAGWIRQHWAGGAVS